MRNTLRNLNALRVRNPVKYAALEAVNFEIPEGTAWCRVCQDFTKRLKPPKDRINGACKPCRDRAYARDRDKILKRAKALRASKPKKPRPKKPSTRNPDGVYSVYLAQARSRTCSEVFYKVGVSIDVPKRLLEFGGSHYSVFLMGKLDFTSRKEALEFEAKYLEECASKSPYTPKHERFGSRTECFLQPIPLHTFQPTT
ncbi:hypothetical protein LIX82_002738 [Vibrio parahaemolyticus]|uniref:hypothetical protein n=1 Tax=Vibrio TaxID=662 RepID=UPI0011324968|nr:MULTISPECIES: hypothetical protein [Vibrio]MCU8520978.1 hypothetical protein [Vibrio vulnificus]EGQ9126127.1 hypothetical protein [Vibrio parahaemolyticus]EHU6456222.1 hypothetical protein [Vibrio parahaemolyticus]EHU9583591.1 hypothetical protein [Vibrio parahaemolyticus]EHV2827126.1 hypothetical protein [Vibrio parahaemolyticus]